MKKTVCVLGFLLCCVAFIGGEDALGKAAREPVDLEVRGRVVCLAEEMHRLHEARLPAGHEHLYGVRGRDGKYYTLLRTALSKAMFVDARLREKELVIRGRVFPGTQLLEVMGMLRSMKNGRLHSLYYYCDICDIKTASPEVCLCCQQEVVLVEEALSD